MFPASPIKNFSQEVFTENKKATKYQTSRVSHVASQNQPIFYTQVYNFRKGMVQLSVLWFSSVCYVLAVGPTGPNKPSSFQTVMQSSQTQSIPFITSTQIKREGKKKTSFDNRDLTSKPAVSLHWWLHAVTVPTNTMLLLGLILSLQLVTMVGDYAQ